MDSFQHKFTAYDIKAMKSRLADKDPYPTPDPSAEEPVRGQSVADHVTHCFQQLYRFANLAGHGGEFRAMQFGLNLGRAQELLGSHGGVEAWWRTFEPLVNAREWHKITQIVTIYCALLGLPDPSVSH